MSPSRKLFLLSSRITAFLAVSTACSLVLDPPPLADVAVETDADVEARTEDVSPPDADGDAASDSEDAPSPEADGLGDVDVVEADELGDVDVVEADGLGDVDVVEPDGLGDVDVVEADGLGDVDVVEADGLGDVDVEVEVDGADATDSEAEAPPNDRCADAEPIALGGTVSGSTVGAEDDVSAVCASVGGADVFYSFLLPGIRDVFLYAESPATFDPVLQVLDECGGANLGCNDDIYWAPGDVYMPALSLPALPPGDYVVQLDGFDATASGSGEFDLTLLATPGATFGGDDCGGPLLIPVPAAPGAPTSVTGDNSRATNLHQGSCGGDRGQELVYYFGVSLTRTVTFSTCNTVSGATDTVLYVRESCTLDSVDLGCNDDMGSACPGNDGASTLTVTLERGVYFLFVDAGGPGGSGWFQVDVTGLY